MFCFMMTFTHCSPLLLSTWAVITSWARMRRRTGVAFVGATAALVKQLKASLMTLFLGEVGSAVTVAFVANWDKFLIAFQMISSYLAKGNSKKFQHFFAKQFILYASLQCLPSTSGLHFSLVLVLHCIYLYKETCRQKKQYKTVNVN